MYAKKSLGQNFLNSKTVASEIVRAGELSPGGTVLEIGPGRGFLTEELLGTGAHVVAIEKDDQLIPFLSEKFADAIAKKQFSLIHGDIVELLETKKLVAPSPYKVIANIPYYITGFILRAFLETETKPERMVLMLQKEVADRIVARDKKESILSISVKAYATPRVVKKVPSRYFTPEPKVDSAVLSLEKISSKNFKKSSDEAVFFNILKKGFAHKRKKLAGNLKEIFGDKTIELLKQAGIDQNARAEDVPLEKWLTLSHL